MYVEPMINSPYLKITLPRTFGSSWLSFLLFFGIMLPAFSFAQDPPKGFTPREKADHLLKSDYLHHRIHRARKLDFYQRLSDNMHLREEGMLYFGGFAPVAFTDEQRYRNNWAKSRITSDLDQNADTLFGKLQYQSRKAIDATPYGFLNNGSDIFVTRDPEMNKAGLKWLRHKDPYNDMNRAKGVLNLAIQKAETDPAFKKAFSEELVREGIIDRADFFDVSFEKLSQKDPDVENYVQENKTTSFIVESLKENEIRQEELEKEVKKLSVYVIQIANKAPPKDPEYLETYRKKMATYQEVAAALNTLQRFGSLFNASESFQYSVTVGLGTVNIISAIENYKRAKKDPKFDFGVLSLVDSISSVVGMVASLFQRGPTAEEMILEQLKMLSQFMERFYEDTMRSLAQIDFTVKEVYKDLSQQIREISLGNQELRSSMHTLIKLSLSMNTLIQNQTDLIRKMDAEKSEKGFSFNKDRIITSRLLVGDAYSLSPDDLADGSFAFYQWATDFSDDEAFLPSPEPGVPLESQLIKNYPTYGPFGLLKILLKSWSELGGKEVAISKPVNLLVWERATQSFLAMAELWPSYLNLPTVRPIVDARIDGILDPVSGEFQGGYMTAGQESLLELRKLLVTTPQEGEVGIDTEFLSRLHDHYQRSLESFSDFALTSQKAVKDRAKIAQIDLLNPSAESFQASDYLNSLTQNQLSSLTRVTERCSEENPVREKEFSESRQVRGGQNFEYNELHGEAIHLPHSAFEKLPPQIVKTMAILPAQIRICLRYANWQSRFVLKDGPQLKGNFNRNAHYYGKAQYRAEIQVMQGENKPPVTIGAFTYLDPTEHFYQFRALKGSWGADDTPQELHYYKYIRSLDVEKSVEHISFQESSNVWSEKEKVDKQVDERLAHLRAVWFSSEILGPSGMDYLEEIEGIRLLIFLTYYLGAPKLFYENEGFRSLFTGENRLCGRGDLSVDVYTSDPVRWVADCKKKLENFVEMQRSILEAKFDYRDVSGPQAQHWDILQKLEEVRQSK